VVGLAKGFMPMAAQLFDCAADRNVVVMGATGSFGRHLTNELARQDRFRSLTLFSRDEERQRLLSIYLERNGVSLHRANFVLGDVRDLDAVRRVVRDADLIINAAALKQVPACELNAFEAVRTNVVGMQNILDAAEEHSVENVLTISTDKAVEPINAMGISKAMQERLVQSHALRFSRGTRTRVCVVRYGNVLGSTGSILPVFIDQALRTQKLLVTNPDMTRFILTLDDALGLVSTALAGTEPSGTIYVRQAPAVTVGDFADVLRRLMDGKVRLSIDVVGARPGDKMHEVLVSGDEMRRSTNMSEWIVIPPVEPVDTAGSGPGPLVDPAPFSSDRARRMPIDQLEALARRWCEVNGVSL
jgi:UDP-glucose 4-epimerase